MFGIRNPVDVPQLISPNVFRSRYRQSVEGTSKVSYSDFQTLGSDSKQCPRLDGISLGLFHFVLPFRPSL